jgi:hypothetical protein
MAGELRTLLHTVEGPKGRVEVYEVEESPAGGATRECVRAMGHAYIVAEELAGVVK